LRKNPVSKPTKPAEARWRSKAVL
jgi:hypothetical protein